MGKSVFMGFDDIDAAVELTGCDDMVALFPSILAGWPYRYITEPTRQADPFLTIERVADGYRFTSPFLDHPEIQPNAVNAVCALVSEMAWASLRTHPERLCVHGAAVELGGQLVLIPNGRRAGKSTLTACMAALGHRIFTDDFLSIEIDGNNQPLGLASGVAPRLRMPLPDDFSAEMASFAGRQENPRNKQYSYLRIDEMARVPRAESLPIGAIVLLQREAGARANLQIASKAEVLKAVILQNFSRAQNAGRILQVLHYLASTVELRVLRYSRAEDAAALLAAEFASWPVGVAGPGLPENNVLPAGQGVPEISTAHAEFDEAEVYTRSATMVEYAVENEHFLADSDGYAIHRLNEMSVAVWNILSEPSTMGQICDLFCEAFPDQPRDRIESDIRNLLGHFTRNRLIMPAPGRNFAVAG